MASADGDDGDIASVVVSEVLAGAGGADFGCPSLALLQELAPHDTDVVVDVLSAFLEAGSPFHAAGVLKRVMGMPAAAAEAAAPPAAGGPSTAAPANEEKAGEEGAPTANASSSDGKADPEGAGASAAPADPAAAAGAAPTANGTAAATTAAPKVDHGLGAGILGVLIDTGHLDWVHQVWGRVVGRGGGAGPSCRMAACCITVGVPPALVLGASVVGRALRLATPLATALRGRAAGALWCCWSCCSAWRSLAAGAWASDGAAGGLNLTRGGLQAFIAARCRAGAHHARARACVGHGSRVARSRLPSLPVWRAPMTPRGAAPAATQAARTSVRH